MIRWRASAGCTEKRLRRLWNLPMAISIGSDARPDAAANLQGLPSASINFEFRDTKPILASEAKMDSSYLLKYIHLHLI
jgi:hypothetical protein